MTYRTGQKVRVADRPHEGHHRTPGYLKGRTGRVERVHAAFTNPESRAYGAEGLPEQRLYLVGFDQPDVWPRYAGPPTDLICVDVFEHWLVTDE
jgi:nitrile hydratase